MTKPVINLDELEFTSFGKGEKFQAERAPVSPNIGGKLLGYAVVKLQRANAHGRIMRIALPRNSFTSFPVKAHYGMRTRNTRFVQAISFVRLRMQISHTRLSTRRMANSPTLR